MKKIYLSNYYSNAHAIYKDMIEKSIMKNKVIYIPIKKIRYISFIKGRFLNLITFKLPFYENEYIRGGNGILFNLGIINYSNLDSYFFLEHFFILNIYFIFLRVGFIKNRIKKILESNKCKGIVCLSREAKNRIDDFFGSEIIKNKTTHIYPSIGHNKTSLIKNNSKFTLLFVANWDFISKGGREVLKCYKKYFKNSCEFEFIIKCNNIPLEYKVDGDNIKYIENDIPYKEIENLYEKSHVLLQPLYKSGYGVFLEAMKYGLPIITSKVFDIPEIVQDGINGYTIDFTHSLFDTKDFYRKFWSIKDFDNWILKSNISVRAVDQMYEKIVMLKTNRDLYNYISKKNLSEVKNGRFSRKVRDNALLNLIS